MTTEPSSGSGWSARPPRPRPPVTRLVRGAVDAEPLTYPCATDKHYQQGEQTGHSEVHEADEHERRG
jgi:hypothetical protein